MRVKVKMLASVKGVDDGEIYPKMFLKDETYEIGGDLYSTFSKAGHCQALKGEKVGRIESAAVKEATAKIAGMDRKELMGYAKEELGIKLKGSGDDDSLREQILDEIAEREAEEK